MARSCRWDHCGVTMTGDRAYRWYFCFADAWFPRLARDRGAPGPRAPGRAGRDAVPATAGTDRILIHTAHPEARHLTASPAGPSWRFPNQTTHLGRAACSPLSPGCVTNLIQDRRQENYVAKRPDKAHDSPSPANKNHVCRWLRERSRFGLKIPTEKAHEIRCSSHRPPGRPLRLLDTTSVCAGFSCGRTHAADAIRTSMEGCCGAATRHQNYGH